MRYFVIKINYAIYLTFNTSRKACQQFIEGSCRSIKHFSYPLFLI